MLRALQRLFGWSASQPPRIRLLDNGFEVVEGSRSLFQIRWADVREVFAFRDGSRTCLGFRIEEGVAYYRVDEDEPGFGALVRELACVLPDHDRNWRKGLDQPALDFQYAPVWTRPPERRSAPRRPARNGTAVACRRGPGGAGPNFARALLDVSPRGVKLLLDTPLHPGDDVLLSLDGGQTVRSGRIAWSVPAGQEFTAGVQLDTAIDERALTSSSA